MPVSPDCNFVFLEEEYPYLAQSACIAESCVYTDPHNCIMKIGLLNEELCRIICSKCGIEISKKDRFEQVVHKLKKHFFNDRDAATYLKIEEVKKSRNIAAHNLPRNEEERRRYVAIAVNALSAGYAISVNFYSSFVNPDYEFPVYRMPGEQEKQESGKRDISEIRDEYSVCNMIKHDRERGHTEKICEVKNSAALGSGIAGGLIPFALSGFALVGSVLKTGALVAGKMPKKRAELKSRGIVPDSVNDFFDSLDLSELDSAKD